MKKIRRTAMLITAVAMILASCGNVTDGKVDSEEIVVPEMSSEDLLVSSLEYLLQEDEDAAKESQGASGTGVLQETEEKKEGQDGKDGAGSVQPGPGHVPKENEAVIYYGNASSYELNQEIIQIEEKTAEELVNALAKHNIVSLDTKVLSFEEKEDAGEKMLYLDLSKAAGEYLKTMSREAECIILASVANTFLENYEADGVRITVDGKPLSTKNAEYAEALRKCTPEELLKEIERFGSGDRQEPEEKEVSGSGDGQEPEEKKVSGSGDGQEPEEKKVCGNGTGEPEDAKAVPESREED